MSAVTFRTGDLFDSTADAIGHGVNCAGVMGTGIAVQFRKRYPKMYKEYHTRCSSTAVCEELGVVKLMPGGLFPWRAVDRWIYNLASQNAPGPNARLTYLRSALNEAVNHAEYLGAHRIALPRTGAGVGGLDWGDVLPVIEQAFEDTRVRCEIWTLPEGTAP